MSIMLNMGGVECFTKRYISFGLNGDYNINKDVTKKWIFDNNSIMSTKETEITVIIPNSKLNDPDFVTVQLYRAKLRILLEVSKSSDRTIESLIQEFLPDVLNNSLLLHQS